MPTWSLPHHCQRALLQQLPLSWLDLWQQMAPALAQRAARATARLENCARAFLPPTPPPWGCSLAIRWGVTMNRLGLHFSPTCSAPSSGRGRWRMLRARVKGDAFREAPGCAPHQQHPWSIIFLQQTRPCALRAVSILCVFAPATEIRDFSVDPGLFRFCMNAGVVRNPLVVGTGWEIRARLMLEAVKRARNPCWLSFLFKVLNKKRKKKILTTTLFVFWLLSYTNSCQCCL